MAEIKAIETRYKGYRFRSRLEARWAVYFDAIGLEWEYEPEGYVLEDGTWYLPDFWLPEVYYRASSRPGIWVEIKGTEPTDRELTNLVLLEHLTGFPALVGIGLPSIFSMNLGNGELWEPCDRDMAFMTGLDGCPHVRVTYGCEGNYRRCQICGKPSQAETYKLYSAVMAARSARFEHGETPA